MKIKNLEIVRKLKDEESLPFSIPFYQRAYKWGGEKNLENIKDFIEDIYTLAKKNIELKDKEVGENEKKPNLQNHYIGTMIFKEIGNNIKIVDGQQRIATIMLICKWVVNELEKYTIDDQRKIQTKSGNNYINLPNTYSSIKESYSNIFLVGGLKDNKKYKISTPRENEKLLNILSECFDPNTIKDNDDYFKGMVGVDVKMKDVIKDWQENNPDCKHAFLDIFFKFGLCYLLVACCELEDYDDEGIIFENSNTKGIPLDTSDLIKNHIIKELSSSQTEESVFFDIFSPFGIQEHESKTYTAFWKFFNIYFKNQGHKKGGIYKEYKTLKDVLEDHSWQGDNKVKDIWKYNFQTMFKVFLLIDVLMRNNIDNLPKTLYSFFDSDLIKKIQGSYKNVISFTLSISTSYKGDYNFFFNSLGVALGRLLEYSTDNSKLLTMSNESFLEFVDFCKILNNYYLSRTIREKTTNGDVIPVFATNTTNKENKPEILKHGFRTVYEGINSLESLKAFMLDKEKTLMIMTIKKEVKGGAYKMEDFLKLKHLFKTQIWDDSKKAKFKPILVFLESLESKELSINDLHSKNFTIEHLRPQSKNNNDDVYLLGNLSLMEGKLNSGASNKKLKNKNEYLHSKTIRTKRLREEASQVEWDVDKIKQETDNIIDTLSKVV